jgi:ligand-binding sensor domain-containing protein/signal transduction histidine kinase
MTFLFFLSLLVGNGEKYVFSHIGLKEGLSQSTVTKIYEDHNGIIWIGTNDGLNRYEGTRISVFKKSASNKDAISDNSIFDILQDKHNRYWIATDNGLNLLTHPYSKKFIKFFTKTKKNPIAHNLIYDMHYDNDSTIWLATEKGITKFNIETFETKNIYEIPLENNHKKQIKLVNHIFIDSEETLWISSNYKYYYRTKGETIFQPFTKVKNANYMYQDSLNNYWISTISSGLYLYSNKFLKLKHHFKEAFTKDIYTFSQLSYSKLWVGTVKSGIFEINMSNYSTSQILHEKQSSDKQNHNEIYDILKSSTGIIWVGTFVNGICKYDPNITRFKHIYPEKNENNTIVGKIVWGINEDYKKNIWVATHSSGLNKIMPSGIVKNYRLTVDKKKKASKVFALHQDIYNQLWAAVPNAGLHKYSDATDSFIEYSFRKGNVDAKYDSFDRISNITEDQNGLLYLSTDYGFYRFDSKNIKTEFFLPDSDKNASLQSNRITRVLVQDENTAWLATYYNGIYKYNLKNKNLVKINRENGYNLTNDYIMSMTLDKHNHLWVGTVNGLNKIQLSDMNITNFQEESGLPNSCIYTLVTDTLDYIWLSTNRGIARIKCESMNSIKINKFDEANNIQDNEFNQNSFHYSKTHKLYFGGINGFNIIEPYKNYDIKYNKAVLISSIKVFDKNINIEKMKLPITLEYNQNYLEFEFATIDHSFSKKNLYKYKLKGFSDKWFDIKEHNKLTLTNLDGGDYTLYVKAGLSEDNWSDKITEISFRVIPAIYEQRIFQILLSIVVLIIAITFHKFRLKKMKRYNQELEVAIRERTEVISRQNEKLKNANVEIINKKDELEKSNKNLEKALTDLKSSESFNNSMVEMIVHDLKNPLNNILTLSQIKPDKQDIRVIHQAANQILNLSMNLLETRKHKHKQLKLDLGNYNLRDLFDDAISQIELLAEQKQVKIYNLIQEELIVNVDFYLLNRVAVNLLTNAIKYTFSGGFIRVEVPEMNTNNLTVKVTDNGKGIHPDDLERIFEKYTQGGDNIEIGKVRSSGLGLSFCNMVIKAHEGKIYAISTNGLTSILFTLDKLNKSNEKVTIDRHKERVNEFVFTEDEATFLNKEIKSLEKVDIYETGEIVTIINTIMKKTDNIKIVNWLNELKNSVFNSNKNGYQELLTYIKNRTHVQNSYR